MSGCEKVVTVSCFVILICLDTVLSKKQLLENEFESFNGQDETWVWGPISDSESNEKSQNTTSYPWRSNDKVDYCSRYEPEKPNFITPGRRTCETKCYEYIWQLKVRYETVKRIEKCHKQRFKAIRGSRPLNLATGATGKKPDSPSEFPHMGAIGWLASTGTWVFKCGSTLISSKFVLTAGHCTRASDTDTTIADPVPKIVRLGDKNIIDVVSNGMPPIDAKIIKIIPHPKYSPPKKYYDIALMELGSTIAFSKFIQPACLWSTFSTDSLGTEGTVTGWGVVETVGKKTSPELQSAVVDIIDTPTCDQLLKPSCNRNWCGVWDNQICAGRLSGGVDACQGDSGGPLSVQIPLPIKTEGSVHYVFGVTSFGIGCALPNLPGIYSRVSMYLDWIESIVWPNDK